MIKVIQAHVEKALAGKPDDLSSNPEIRVAEEN